MAVKAAELLGENRRCEVSQDYEKPCRETLELLINDGLIEAAILCTVDGLPIAHASHLDVPEDALSAMSASMLALADAVIGQVGSDGGCRQVVAESSGRTVAIVHAGENMALAVAGKPGTNLGMVISHANLTVKNILTIIAKSQDKKEIEQHVAPTKNSLDELMKRVLQEVENNKK